MRQMKASVSFVETSAVGGMLLMNGLSVHPECALIRAYLLEKKKVFLVFFF
jgi:hypothetical protein